MEEHQATVARRTGLREAALEYHRSPVRVKISVTPTKPLSNQRDLSLAYSPGVAYACLAIEENPALAADFTSRGNLVGVVTNGNGGAGPGRHRPAGRQAGDGARAACSRSSPASTCSTSSSPRKTRQAGRDHRRARAHAGRRQPRGHQGAGVLHHRAPPARAHEHPGLPRRPARHRHHLAAAVITRPGAGGQADRRDQARRLGRRRGGDRLPGPAGGAGREAREHLRLRFAGVIHDRREDRLDESKARYQRDAAHAGRRHGRRRRGAGLLGGRRDHAGHGQDHGRQADHPRAGQPRAGNPPRAGAPRADCIIIATGRSDYRTRSTTCCASLHLPRRAGLRRHPHHRGDEAGLRARDRGAGQGRDQRRGGLGLFGPRAALRADYIIPTPFDRG